MEENIKWLPAFHLHAVIKGDQQSHDIQSCFLSSKSFTPTFQIQSHDTIGKFFHKICIEDLSPDGWWTQFGTGIAILPIHAETLANTCHRSRRFIASASTVLSNPLCGFAIDWFVRLNVVNWTKSKSEISSSCVPAMCIIDLVPTHTHTHTAAHTVSQAESHRLATARHMVTVAATPPCNIRQPARWYWWALPPVWCWYDGASERIWGLFAIRFFFSYILFLQRRRPAPLYFRITPLYSNIGRKFC